MKARTSVMMAFLLVFALPLTSQAQWRLGTHAGYDVDVKELLIGVNAQFTIPGAAIAGVPVTRFRPECRLLSREQVPEGPDRASGGLRGLHC